MKVREVNVEIFMAELEKFEQIVPAMRRECRDWLAYGQTYTGADRQQRRDVFVRRVLKFRTQLGELYDLMSERGLRNIG